jgi:hypothetical protein
MGEAIAVALGASVGGGEAVVVGVDVGGNAVAVGTVNVVDVAGVSRPAIEQLASMIATIREHSIRTIVVPDKKLD